MRLAGEVGRSVTRLGNAVVMKLSANEIEPLRRAWQAYADAGASWSFDEYVPHITIAYDESNSIDVEAIKPFTGDIILTGEVWKELIVSKAIECEVSKVSEALGVVFGFAIVCKIDGDDYYDTQGDHIPEDTMLRAVTDFMEGDREAKVMHRGGSVGKVVFGFPLTEEIASALNITSRRTGFLVGMKPDSKEVLSLYISGEYTGFSIGGRVRAVESE